MAAFGGDGTLDPETLSVRSITGDYGYTTGALDVDFSDYDTPGTDRSCAGADSGVEDRFRYIASGDHQQANAPAPEIRRHDFYGVFRDDAEQPLAIVEYTRPEEAVRSISVRTDAASGDDAETLRKTAYDAMKDYVPVHDAGEDARASLIRNGVRGGRDE